MRPRWLLAPLLALIVVACAGGATATPAPVTSAPVTPAPVTPAPESPLPAAGCPEVPEPTGMSCFTVTIRDFAFDPPVLTIPTRARVVFVNADGIAHSIAWSDGTPPSPTLADGDTTARDFSGDAAATIEYHCGIHPSMRGTVILDASLPVP
jgi:plastocyanin